MRCSPIRMRNDASVCGESPEEIQSRSVPEPSIAAANKTVTYQDIRKHIQKSQ
jgi:hypothetical protein